VADGAAHVTPGPDKLRNLLSKNQNDEDIIMEENDNSDNLRQSGKGHSTNQNNHLAVHNGGNSGTIGQKSSSGATDAAGLMAGGECP